MLEHGGRVRAAARRYGIPEADWLDLSTGINPHAYPLPAIPVAAWQRLPEDDDGLLDTARAYYGTPRLVALAGSQPAIQALPHLLGQGRRLRVGVLAPTYAEHPQHWRLAGHEVKHFALHEMDRAAEHADVLVLCQPNNPDATRLPRADLIGLAERLAARGGQLVIDEAFVDATPEESLVALAGGALPNLVVLRSLGKFFGLAGARVGFVAARPELLAALAETAGPWPLAGPARVVAQAALADRSWQETTRRRLTTASARLATLLAPYANEPLGINPLFVWWPTPHAAAIADALARQGILVRCFESADAHRSVTPAGLRFGLPGGEAEWHRLARALAAIPGQTGSQSDR